MYELNDTIVAVSSPTPEQNAIIRITGPETIRNCKRIFSPAIRDAKPGLIKARVAIDTELSVDAKLYLFLAPHSYTGDDVAEIHIHTNPSVTEALVANLLDRTANRTKSPKGTLDRPLRMAGPGEFTARAYLNGKIDLAQAEAVNEIVVSSNEFQLAAAERLLAGRLAELTAEVRSELLDCLSLLEAGLDFSGEDIEFITRPEAIRRLARIKQKLEHLLSDRYRDESVVGLPAVGIAGAANAGKSSLLNKLLGWQRSIVSEQHKTTRDVLTALYTLEHSKAVLFDCAGLSCPESSPRKTGLAPKNILDELAQQAAVESLRNSSVVLFCIDISKADWAEDASIRKLIEPKIPVFVATKSDLLSEDRLAERLTRLSDLFGADVLATSTETGAGIELLQKAIDRKIIESSLGHQTSAVLSEVEGGIALTARHRQAVTEAIENITESTTQLKLGNDDITAMMLRTAYQAISGIESPFLLSPAASTCVERRRGKQESMGIDEKILDRIFSRFCIGK